MVQQKIKIESLNIGLASPIRIRKWAERILPNGKKIGQVTNSKTVNYKTLKPEIGGLFCEKIFGPIKDFECLCGFKKIKFKTKNKFCPNCDVEFTASQIRRYRLGYIKLASPVTHIWYLRGRPRFLNILFDMAIALNKGKIKDLKPIIYSIDALYLPILKLIKTNLIPFSNNSHKKKIFVSRYQQDSFLVSSFASRFYFSHCKNTINILKKKNNYKRNSILQDSFKSEISPSKFFLSKQNKFSYYKILPDLFEIKKKKLFQRRRAEISFNIIKPKPVSKIYHFLLLEVFEFYEYQMVNLFIEKNYKAKTQENSNNSKTLNFYNGFSVLSQKNFQRSLENFQNQSSTNNVYFSKTLKTNFLNYFYNKKTLFSQQLSKTFCNSYYLTYSFPNINLSDKKKNRKKKLNKFLKKNLYINLSKTQKTRIFLFDQKIFLNKKKLKIQNKNSQRSFANFQSFAKNSLKKSPIFFESFANFQRSFENSFASIKPDQNLATTLYDREKNQSSIKIISQQACKKNFNPTYLDFTRNFHQQNILEIILIINWKLKLLEKKNFQRSLETKFVNQDFSNLFRQIFTSNKAIKLKLIFCWLKNEKTLVQFLFSIVTLTNKKKIRELKKNEKFSAELRKFFIFSFLKKNKPSQSEPLRASGLKDRRSFLPPRATKFYLQSKVALPLRNKKIVTKKTQIKYDSYFLTKNILKTKTIQKRQNTFSKVSETLDQKSFSIQKTKIKLNLFFYYCFKKKKFVNFNGKILCLKKIKKQQIINLIRQINLKKEKIFFNDEKGKKTFNKIALSTKQTLRNVHGLVLLNSSILENLVNKKKSSSLASRAAFKKLLRTSPLASRAASYEMPRSSYELSKKNLTRFFLNTSNFDQLKKNKTIFFLYCNFAFKPKIASADKTSLVYFSLKKKNLQIFEAPLKICILNDLKWGQIKQKKKRASSWNFINHNLVKSYILFFFQNRETWFTNLLVTTQNRKDFIKTNFKTNVTKTDFRLYYKTHFLLSKNLYQYSRFLRLLQKNKNYNKKFWNQLKQNQRDETNLKIFLMIFNSNLCLKKLRKFICNYLIITNDYNISFTYKNLLCYLRFCLIESSKQTSEPIINHGFNIHGSFENSSQIFFDFNILIRPIESQINSYYPVYSKSILKLSEQKKKKFEFKDLWESFITYITSNSTEQDIRLFFYSNRLERFNLKKFQLGTQIFDQAFFFSLKHVHCSPSLPAVNKIISDSKKYFVPESKVVSKKLALEQYKYVKRILTGTEAIFYWLASLNLEVLKTKLKSKIDYLDTKINQFRDRPFLYDFQKKLLKKIIKIRRKIVKLMKLIYYLKKNKSKPEWLMISILPVLPPNLRPIIQVDANQIAVSDLNQLYKRIIYRNQRIEKYLTKNEQSDSSEIRFHQRLLQESVDALLDNGKGGSPLACSPSGRAFKSLSEILKGKKGRFRQNLLGKRVDYSGRSVIIVGPNLKLHQCGLPKKMAIELFQPFLIRELKNLSGNKIIDRKITIIKAKKLIQKKHPIIWKILEKILKNHPILLNRAPTLHRLGIQAFQPKLIEGKAILLHPLVCSAFNADFDGDQMAVHVPLCFQARAEAWKLMWSRNNLLSPATGEPILTPSQDMILGCYYLTTKKTKSQLINFSFLHKQKNQIALQKLIKNYKQTFNKKKNLNKLNRKNLYFQLKQVLTFCESSFPLQSNNLNNRTILNKYFNNLNDVLISFFQENISIHSLVWIKWQNNLETENFNEKPLEIRVDCYGNSIKIYSQYFHNLNHQNQDISQFILTTVGRIILNKIILENIFFYNSNFSVL